MYFGLKMIADVPTVTPKTLVMEADKIMEKRHLWMLMAVDDQGRYIGAVRKEDVRAALPSPVTTLSRHELNYLLSKLTLERAPRLALIYPNHPYGLAPIPAIKAYAQELGCKPSSSRTSGATTNSCSSWPVPR